MQVVDANGNVFGQGLEITGIDGKPKVPVINTDITIGTTVINGGVSGRLLFDDAGVVGETANISWNKATNILTLNGDITYTTYNRTIASSTYPLGTLFTGTIRSISQINHSGGTNGLTIGGNGGSPIFRIWDNGNVTIQLNGTYVDAGYRLDVNGTTRLQRTLDLGSIGYAGTINLRRAGDGGITSQITQTDDVTVIHNYQGSGTEFKVDNVTYFHVRGFANQYAARVMGNLTAVSGLSTALLVNNAISASANNDVLIGLDVAPTFNNGAFTGVQNYAARFGGNVIFTQGGKTISIAAPTTSGSGGGLTISAGNATTSGTGGSISLQPGNGAGGPGAGTVIISNTSWWNGATVNGTLTVTNSGPNTGTSLQVNAGGQNGLTISWDNLTPFMQDGLVSGRQSRFVNSSSYSFSTNLIIGATVNAGYMLDVNGTVRSKSDLYVGYDSIAAGSTYIQINPDKFNSKIIFNDFDGGTGTRGGILEMSTYKSRLTYGSYNWFYIGDSINPFMFYIAPSTGNFILTRQNTQPTDAGFKLDVNGTARVQGDTTITKTGSALSVQFTSQTAQNNFFTVLNGTDGLQLTSRGSGTTGNMGLPANSAEILSFNKAALGLILHTTAYLAIGTHTAERMRLISSTGNLLIGTTTDAGFRLNVNGSINIAGGSNLNFSNASLQCWITTAGTTGLGSRSILLPGSGGNGPFTFYNASGQGISIIDSTGDSLGFGPGNTSSTAIMSINKSASSGFGGGAFIYYRTNANNRMYTFGNPSNERSDESGSHTRLAAGAAGFLGNGGHIYLESGAAGTQVGSVSGNIIIAETRGNVLIGTSTNVSSAIVNVSSTTKGFLPPRMTNAQMLAIATPSAGLIVYDTTNNKHYGYDGTTWNPFY
jgi:hypothetical protein